MLIHFEQNPSNLYFDGKLINIYISKYGTETWKAALEVMVTMSVKAQKELQDIKKEIQDVNWKRKSKQLQTGDKLNQLNSKWVGLVSCNYEIEQAISQLEIQVLQATAKRETDLKSETNGHGVTEAEDVEME